MATVWTTEASPDLSKIPPFRHRHTNHRINASRIFGFLQPAAEPEGSENQDVFVQEEGFVQTHNWSSQKVCRALQDTPNIVPDINVNHVHFVKKQVVKFRYRIAEEKHTILLESQATMAKQEVLKGSFPLQHSGGLGSNCFSTGGLKKRTTKQFWNSISTGHKYTESHGENSRKVYTLSELVAISTRKDKSQ